jgi:hypothetical protein
VERVTSTRDWARWPSLPSVPLGFGFLSGRLSLNVGTGVSDVGDCQGEGGFANRSSNACRVVRALFRLCSQTRIEPNPQPRFSAALQRGCPAGPQRSPSGSPAKAASCGWTFAGDLAGGGLGALAAAKASVGLADVASLVHEPEPHEARGTGEFKTPLRRMGRRPQRSPLCSGACRVGLRAISSASSATPWSSMTCSKTLADRATPLRVLRRETCRIVAG